MKNFLLFGLVLFITTQLSSQNNQPDNKLKSKAATQSIRQKSFSSANIMVVSQPTASEYFGYDENIKLFLIKEIIPANFPKATGISTKEEYINIINKWFIENRGLVKPENQNKTFNEK